MATRHAVLLADDHWQEVEPLLAVLPEDIAVVPEARGDCVLSVLERRTDIAAVLLDLKFDGQPMQGREILDAIKECHPRLPVIVLTATSDVNLALTLVGTERKAYYYFVKEQLDPDQFAATLRNAIEHYALSVDALRVTARGEIVGDSPEIRAALDLVSRVAESRHPVMITGETGTGKELFACAIHRASKRRGAFIAVNCGAVSPELAPAAFFGARKGAYTDAKADLKGYFEEAEGGTLFLDEITEMPPEVQIGLLRAVQENEIQRVGGGTRKADVRIVAASNRDLDKEVESRRFREDLRFRLERFLIDLPPLREHPEDIPALVRHIVAKQERAKPLTPRAMELLCRVPWPGNVRELETVLIRALTLADGDTIDEEAIAEQIEGRTHSAGADLVSEWVERLMSGAAGWPELSREFEIGGETMHAILDRFIRRLKRTCGRRPTGNDLAQALGVNRNHVNQILNQIGIRLREYE